MRWQRTVVALACLCGLLVLDAPVTRASHDISRLTFGVVEGNARPDDADKLGVGWERIIVPWWQYQPAGPQEFNTDVLPDSYVRRAQAAGRQIVGLIKGTPGWASSSGSLAALPRGLNLPYIDPGNPWGAFILKLVGHYAPLGLHDWIIWNEPDIRPGEGTVEFEGDVADYAQLLKISYLAAHTADPDVHIRIAGISWWHDLQAGRVPYLQRMLEVLAKDPDGPKNSWYFDGICTHIYFTTSSVWTILKSNRDILARFGLSGKAIWLTEFNASPRLDPKARLKARFQVSLDQQADFIIQASALALAAGVERLAVFKLYDNDFVPGQTEPWGLVRADGTLRPAFLAYQGVIQHFSGVQRVQRYDNGQATLVTLTFPDRTLYVIWSDTFQAGQVVAPASDITVYDAIGRPVQEPQAGVIELPGAEKIDVESVVVAGAVRILSLPGAPRRVEFRTGGGIVVPLN